MSSEPSDIPASPKELVQFFLQSMQDRNLEQASRCLHADFTMIFPGGVSLSSLQELVDWSKPRYTSIGKTFDSFELTKDQSGLDVVWCYGTLNGTWLDGKSFDGIRFVDRFTIQQGLLLNQQVWNDLAEVKIP